MCEIRLSGNVCRKLLHLYAESRRLRKEFAGLVFSPRNCSYRVDYIIGDEGEVSVKRVLALVKKNKMFVEFLWHTHHVSNPNFSQQDLKALRELKIPISLISNMSFKLFCFKVCFSVIVFVYDQPFVVKDFMGVEKSIEHKGFHLIWIPLNPFLRFLQRLKWLFFGRPEIRGFIDFPFASVEGKKF